MKIFLKEPETDTKTRILIALKKGKVSQTALAKELGVVRGTVSEMLSREGEPPLRYIEATSKLTGISMDWIMIR